MIIREATEADHPRILEMAVRFLTDSVYAGVIRVNVVQLAHVVATVPTMGVLYVAEEDGAIFGFLAMLRLTHPLSADEYAEELAWWVDPEARGGRAAIRLLRAGEQWAREQGLRVIKMGAPAGSPVCSHYERLGYSPLEVTFLKRL